MKEMYMASSYGIEKRKIVKETEKQVLFIDGCGRERRGGKATSYDAWFNTFAQAKNYLIEKSENRIKSYSNNLTKEQDKLFKIKLLEEK